MMPEKFKGQREKYKIGLVAGLFVISCLSVYYFHAVLKTCIIVSHFFYIPIILACIWWKRKGLIVAIFSSAFLIFSHFLIRPDMTTINDYVRAIMFVAIAIVAVLLSEHSAKAEEKLKNSEKRLQILFEFAPDAYFLYDLEGIVIDVNKAAKEIIGYEKHELIGKKFSELKAFPEDQIFKAKHVLAELANGKPVGPTELTLNRKDGKQVIVEIRTYPVKVEGQTLLLGIARDITERKQAEKEKNKILHDLKERMKELNCLYEILNTVEIPNISLNEIFEKILKVIQTGWQYPEITCVRIMINGKEYKTPNYKDTEWKQSAWIKAYGDVIGDIDIFYLEEKPKIYEGPFLKEERKLINSIAKHLGKIIERKQTEKALIESETKYRTLVDHLPAIIYIAALDETSTTLFVSYQVEALLGYTQKEYIDDPDIWVKHLHADDRERVLREVAQCHATGEPLQIEYRMLHRDGRVMWFRDEAIIVRDADGESNQLQGFMLDITERKQAEETLRKSGKQASAAIEAAKAFTYNYDIGTGKIEWGGSIKEITGYTPEEFAQIDIDGWKERIHPDDKDRVLSILQDAINNKDRATAEYRFRIKKGGYVILSSISLTEKKDGKAVRLVGILQDITENKKAEEALRESEGKLNAMLQSIGDHMSMMDKDLNIIWANTIAMEIFGNDIIGKKCYKVYHGKEEPCDRGNCITIKAFRDGNVHEHDTQVIDKDGKIVYFHCTANAALKDKDGNPTAVMEISRDITENKKAEEALRTSEAQLSNAMEIAKLGYWEYDVANDLFTFNDHFYDIFRTTVEKVGGYKMSSEQYAKRFIHPDDMAVVGIETRKAIETTDPNFNRQLEHRIIYDNGEIGYIAVRFFIVKDKQGRTIKTYGANQDITERKQAEETIKKAEQDWRNSFNSLEDTMLIIDKDFNIENINENGLRLLDKNKNEVIGKKCYQPIHNLEKPCDFCPLKKSLETKVVESIERYEETLDKHFSIKCSPVFDENREIVKFVDLLSDITERKKAEEKLRDSEEYNSSLLNNSPNPIIVINPDTSVRYVNPALEKITGFSFEELIGCKSPYPWWTEETLKKTSKDFKKATRGGALKLEELFQKKNGDQFWVEITSIPVKNDDVFNYYLANWVDITEKKHLQEFALRAQRLETAGRVAGQVAHDFNNLLAPLMAYPELIREELPKDHPVLQYIEEIERAAEQITEINQQLLTLGRRGHYGLEPLSLNDIVTNVVNQIHIVPETLVIETDLSDKLMNIKGGSSQIFRAILNLVHNARDAMMDVGQLTIKTENYYVDKLSGRFGRVPRGEYVKLTVSDTGSGIPADIMPKILDPFFTTKTTIKRRGSGLGLSIVHAVVEDHNGYIDVESTVGEGTNFYLYFPITRESSEETIPEQVVGGTENILVVDDDKVQRDVASRLLEKLGYKASTVESGEKAIDFIKEKPQDMLLLDMIMPDGIDGAETYEEALKVNSSQKAIIISGYKETQRVEEALKLGAGVFIRKPLTLKTIAQALRKELDKKQAITSPNNS